MSDENRKTERGIFRFTSNTGQLGNNSTTESHVPVAVGGLGSGVMGIASGYGHTCALTTADAVLCWGYNFYGQLGNNSNANSPVPVAVIGLGRGAVAIATGGLHTCALTTAGGELCWGWHSDSSFGLVVVDTLNANVLASFPEKRTITNDRNVLH